MRSLMIIGVAALALCVSAAALAGTLTATTTVTGTAGISLNLPANPSLSSTLDGSDQTVSYSPLLGVVDARGSGAGWNLQISASDFDDGSGHTLAPGVVSSAAQTCHEVTPEGESRLAMPDGCALLMPERTSPVPEQSAALA